MLQIFLSILETTAEQTKFEELYHRYMKLMHYVANQFLKDDRLAEDAVQEAFIRVAKNFYKVGDVHSPQTRKFLIVVVRNVAKTMCANAQSATSLNDVTIEIVSTHGSVIFEDFTLDELTEEILQLPELYRDILYLHSAYDYMIAESANLLGITVAAAKKRIQRARKLLLQKLEEDKLK